jgi:NAD(P)-dependent dehydrogenase (short-subunit alcohol dehydrogenase family)
VNLELENKVVLITGGSDGLGLALAKALVDEGASAVICGRSEERLAAAASELDHGPGELAALRCDVTQPDEIEALAQQIAERFGRLDGLVNNAGRSAAFSLAATTDELWFEDLDLKLHAHVRLIRRCLPLLEASASASVINVLAVAGKAPAAGTLPTSVSRAASLALTKSLSKELGPRGIRVNALLIGLIRSGQWVRLADAGDGDVEELYASMAQGAGIPLGRVGLAEEFADVAAFLLSARSGYVTGTGINLDGGMSPVT